MFFEQRSIPIRGSGYARGSHSWLISDSGHVPATVAMRNSDIRTAITILASDIARVTYSTGNKKLDKLLAAPSKMTGRYAFMQSMMAQMLLDGNAYALRREDKAGHEYWEYVSPSHVVVNLADDGQSLSYDFSFDSVDERDEKDVEASDVIHFRLLGIDGGLMGRSPLESLQTELSLQKSSRNLALNIFKRAVNPTSVLKYAAKMSPAAKNEAREAFEEANSGDNSGRALIMDNNSTFEQLEVKSDVAKLLQSTDWTREQIAKVFMIPSDSLGSESQHSNIDQMQAQYNTALGRYIAAVVDELSLKLGQPIITNVREAIDLDGSKIEARTIALVKDKVISSDVGLEILKRSHSDLVTPEIITAVEINSLTSKGGDDDGKEGISDTT
ncbi:phage portal protein [Weissella kandleri]|uniref:phage portal protein n=1 Tax=Weissella kandleri TaxID=1616 RepID=UPI00387E552B